VVPEDHHDRSRGVRDPFPSQARPAVVLRGHQGASWAPHDGARSPRRRRAPAAGGRDLERDRCPGARSAKISGPSREAVMHLDTSFLVDLLREHARRQPRPGDVVPGSERRRTPARRRSRRVRAVHGRGAGPGVRERNGGACAASAPRSTSPIPMTASPSCRGEFLRPGSAPDSASAPRSCSSRRRHSWTRPQSSRATPRTSPGSRDWRS